MKSWKIGAIAGLIAGILFAIVEITIGVPIIVKLGFAQAFPIFYEAPFMIIATSAITVNLVMGTLLGVIYSKANRVLPGKAIIKGLIFGLFGILLWNIYFAIIFLPYRPVMLGLVELFLFAYLFSWITYGLALGIIYQFLHDRYGIPKKEPKVIEYDMKGGILPGIITGIITGAGGFIFVFLQVYFGTWPLLPRESIDLTFILSQLGTQIMIHLIPGIYLGAIYPKVYNLVPGKGILKGLCYGLIVTFVFTELRAILNNLSLGDFIGALGFFISGISMAIIFGLAIGFLYKPPK